MKKLINAVKSNKRLQLVAVILFVFTLGLTIIFFTQNPKTEEKGTNEDDQRQEETSERELTIFTNQGSTVTARSQQDNRLTQVKDYEELRSTTTVSTSQESYALIALEDQKFILAFPDTEIIAYPEENEDMNFLSGEAWIKSTIEVNIASELVKVNSRTSAYVISGDNQENLVRIDLNTADVKVLDNKQVISETNVPAGYALTVRKDNLNDFEGGAAEKYVNKFDQAKLSEEEQQKFEFLVCMDSYLESLISENQITNDSIEDGFTTCLTIVNPKPEIESTENVSVDSIEGKFIDENTLECKWTSSASDIQGYAFWIGTTSGQVDVKAETFVETNSAQIDVSAFDSDSFYCSVRVISADGSGEKTSARIDKPKSDATVGIDLILDQQNDNKFDGTVSGQIEGEYEVSDIKVEAYVLSSNDEYLNKDGEWQKAKNIFQLTINPDNSFSGILPTQTIQKESFTIVVQVIDIKNPRVIAESTINIK